MLAGFGGRLISEWFLERLVDERSEDREAAAGHRALATWRRQSRHLGPASSLRQMLEAGAAPFSAVLGYSGTGTSASLKGALATEIRAGMEPVGLLTASWGEPLDGLWRPGVEHAARIGASWCLLFNGTHARLIAAHRLYARRYVEFNVDLAADDARTHRAMALVMSAGAMVSDESASCALDGLLQESEEHSAGVCRSLRRGVLDASSDIFATLSRKATRSRREPPDREAAFEQSLTIVYRILFLLFAEARQLVPLWHPIYSGSYSIESLCAIAERGRAGAGLWDGIRAITRLAHAGCCIGDLSVTAFNGRLFSPSRTPLAERRGLDAGAAQRALLALSTQRAADRQARERVPYRDFGVEELGGVYESLLDYRPSADGTLRPSGDERKATGTFYTPRAIAAYLARRTLAPLVRDQPPERILELKVADPSMGSGAFLVAACGFLGDAYEQALVRSGACNAADIGPAERASIRRTVAERCLFGVDVNPMAVQLARLSLWLTTLAADRPLSFLDHHLAVGDSVLGAWLSSLRRDPTPVRRPRDTGTLPLFDTAALADAMHTAIPLRIRLAEEPNLTAAQVHDKERLLAELNRPASPLSRWRRLADFWCAHWFGRWDRPPASAYRALAGWILHGTSELPAATAERHAGRAAEIAAANRFFHWELEFPEVFFDASGQRRSDAGFDAVLGNPPWDMIRADAGDVESRTVAREKARGVLHFTRESGVYSHQSDGHANRFQLFLERGVGLLRAGGRIGLVLPSGFTADHGSARLRHMVFSTCSVDALIGFENSRRIFPIHRSTRFHLLTATRGQPTRAFGCRLGEQDPAVLESDPEDGANGWFPVRLTPALLERLTGADMSVPDLRSPDDLRIAERAATLFRPLGSPEGWAVHFGRELNATDDRPYFQPGASGGMPVVEGKLIEPFRVDTQSASTHVDRDVARQLLGARYLRRRLAYRDVASPTNRLTLIAAVLPGGCVSTHTVFCLRTPLNARDQYFLSALFNSFVVNFLVRLRVTTHVTTGIVERLPIPRERDCSGAFAELAVIARQLASRGANTQLMARLNARVAAIYQLSRDEFAHVLGTFPLVPGEERDAALAAFGRET